MPRRPFRFQDFGRAARFQLLAGQRLPAEQNGSDDSSASSEASDEEMVMNGMQSESSEDAFSEESVAGSDDEQPALGGYGNHEEEEGEIDNLDDEPAGNNAEDASGSEPDQGQDEVFSESDEEEENVADGNGHLPLYPNAPVTVGESMHMVLMFALNHHLSGKCIGDLLELISLHCIRPNRCVPSLYHFKKYFRNVDMPIRRHYYCTRCSLPLNGDQLCEICGRNQNKSYFITLPIIPQLRSMFSRQGFYAKLSHRFERVKEHADNLEDVYDGELYKSQCRDGGFLTDRNAISFCWNSDGVACWKSSQYSLWPFFLRINELPYQDRVRQENIILAGLWFGNKKPNVNMFLLPLLPELRLLHEGVEVNVPPLNQQVTIKAIVLNGTCDMPAKALFLNFRSYNGYFGCTACKIRGERLPGNIHVYRVAFGVNMRTDEEVEVFARQANQFREPFMGVKGVSILSRIVPNLVTGTAIDPMHKYSGLMMKLLMLWFSSDYHAHPASMSQLVRVADDRLCKITPPVFVERLPRSLKHVKYYKISELKAMLLTYSIPLLCDMMPQPYFLHHLLLANGLYLLNQTSISPEVLVLADSLLREYVIQYEQLYGLEHMTCNVHQLLHLGRFSKNLGPLFASSCAPFESMNGVLKKYVKGTRFADLQVCTAASLYAGLSIFRERDLRDDGPVQEFCTRLSRRQMRLRLHEITRGVSAAAKLKLLQPVPAEIRNLLLNAAAPAENVYMLKKVYFRKRLYIAQSYVRAQKTKSFCVKLNHDGREKIGLIRYFLKVSACDCQFICHCPASCFAVVNLCDTVNPFSTRAPYSVLSFIHECTYTDIDVLVSVEDFISQCFLIVVDDTNKTYAVEPVNDLETDD